MNLSPENQAWLAEFKECFGRPPRVLHIGNIANNAYNNAKMLIEAGFDCDVICYDYYHIMGCPEWEDADFAGDYGDQFKPDWIAARVQDFERPRWFAQGPLLECIEYLVARRKNQAQKAESRWLNLATLNGTRIPQNIDRLRQKLRRMTHILSFIFTEGDIASKIARSRESGKIASMSKIKVVRILIAWALLSVVYIVKIGGFSFKGLTKRNRNELHSFDVKALELVNIFAQTFPSRSDQLAVSDIELYRRITPQWQRLFGFYDLVQAYATDPILPLIAGKQPYIAFEHGTLRGFTLGDDPICRQTSLAYHLADHVFITNGDCIDFAKKIEVTRFTPMLHPVNERRVALIDGQYTKLRSELGVRYVFLCTLRHDWSVKGTDQYIRALPELAKFLGQDFKVIMTRWGADLEKSVALAELLNVADFIIWSEPFSRRRLIQVLKSVDVLFDQVALPHFGATAPEGIAAGVPVIMSYKPESTAWIISEPAPILSAQNEKEIAQQVQVALNPDWLADYRHRAKKWIDKHHCSSIVLNGHADVYRKLIDNAKG